MPGIDDFLDLIVHYNPADDRSLPIIVRSNQSSYAVVQFQSWISQYVGHSKWRELRANGTDDDHLWSVALDDEAANHYIVRCLDKAASADVGQD